MLKKKVKSIAIWKDEMLREWIIYTHINYLTLYCDDAYMWVFFVPNFTIMVFMYPFPSILYMKYRRTRHSQTEIMRVLFTWFLGWSDLTIVRKSVNERTVHFIPFSKRRKKERNREFHKQTHLTRQHNIAGCHLLWFLDPINFTRPKIEQMLFSFCVFLVIFIFVDSFLFVLCMILFSLSLVWARVVVVIV